MAIGAIKSERGHTGYFNCLRLCAKPQRVECVNTDHGDGAWRPIFLVWPLLTRARKRRPHDEIVGCDTTGVRVIHAGLDLLYDIEVVEDVLDGAIVRQALEEFSHLVPARRFTW